MIETILTLLTSVLVTPRPPRRCQINSDCSENDACVLTLCANPCLTDNPCHTTAVCKPYNKQAYCFCPTNTSGDPYIQCLPTPESRKYTLTINIFTKIQYLSLTN